MSLSKLTRLTISDTMKKGEPFQKSGVEIRPLPNNMYGIRKTDWPTDVSIPCLSMTNALAAFELLLDGRIGYNS